MDNLFGRLTLDGGEEPLVSIAVGIGPIELEPSSTTSTPTLKDAVDSMKEMFSRQAVMMAEFIQSQQRLMQTMLTALTTTWQSEETLNDATHGVTGEPVFSPLFIMSTPIRVSRPEDESAPIVAATVVDEWKEIALSFARRGLSALPVLEKPLFRSGDRGHPVAFLHKFERYFLSTKLPAENKLEVVKRCLDNQVLDWVYVQEGGWDGFDDLRRDFLNDSDTSSSSSSDEEECKAVEQTGEDSKTTKEEESKKSKVKRITKPVAYRKILI
ncbi:hypothetical protein FQA39_LY17283 [Lamprigera yunnana]|nr:hypothetical protein FQA39_LY17283 [Lamprigera yunnana]